VSRIVLRFIAEQAGGELVWRSSQLVVSVLVAGLSAGVTGWLLADGGANAYLTGAVVCAVGLGVFSLVMVGGSRYQNRGRTVSIDARFRSYPIPWNGFQEKWSDRSMWDGRHGWPSILTLRVTPLKRDGLTQGHLKVSGTVNWKGHVSGSHLGEPRDENQRFCHSGVGGVPYVSEPGLTEDAG
jgi:hypothetical protein